MTTEAGSTLHAPPQETNGVIPSLSLIIVAWNGRRYVQECLRSIEVNHGSQIEVIVVDNGSTDGTPEAVKEEFPTVKLIANTENLGFARANNLGMRQSRGKYLCLVNSDVVLPEGCLNSLFRYMEANPDVGVVGPRMFGLDGKVHRSTMRCPTLGNCLARALAVDRLPLISWAIKGQMMSDFQHSETTDVEILNGWFWMVRREALTEVGLLDEQFFMYGEDLDWCYRFRKSGWRVVFYAGAAALHYGAGSSRVAPERFYIEMQRANFQYWRKHHDPIACWLSYGIVFVHHLLRLPAYAAAYALNRRAKRDAATKMRRSWALLVRMIEAKV